MGNFLEKVFETIIMVLVSFLLFLFLVTVSFIFTKCGKKDVINELCQKQQYDFCEVKETIYKFKEQEQWLESLKC